MGDITHYNGCWQDPKHHACALREIERLRALLHESFDALTSNEDTCNDFCALRGEIWEALGHE